MSLDQYLAEIKRYPLLTLEKELEVARAAKTGDSASRELLIKSNLRLVVNIAKKYSKNGNLLDLVGEGNIALVKAAEEYDPKWGAKFSTYASRGINWSIWSYLNSQDMIRLPPEQKKLMSTIYQISNKYNIANSIEPTPQDIADEINRQQSKKRYTGDDVQELLQMYENISVVSLDRPVGDDGNSKKMDFIPGKDGREILENIARKDIADKVRTQISQLKTNKKNKKILEMILFENTDLNEIATALDKKREQIRQKYLKGLRLLRSELKKSGIFDSYISTL